MCFGTTLTLHFSFFPIGVFHGSNHDCLLEGLLATAIEELDSRAPVSDKPTIRPCKLVHPGMSNVLAITCGLGDGLCPGRQSRRSADG